MFVLMIALKYTVYVENEGVKNYIVKLVNTEKDADLQIYRFFGQSTNNILNIIIY